MSSPIYLVRKLFRDSGQPVPLHQVRLAVPTAGKLRVCQEYLKERSKHTLMATLSIDGERYQSEQWKLYDVKLEEVSGDRMVISGYQLADDIAERHIAQSWLCYLESGE